MATDQGVGSSNLLTHVNEKGKTGFCPVFLFSFESGSDSNEFEVFAPLRSALSECPPDIQGLLTHVCEKSTFFLQNERFVIIYTEKRGKWYGDFFDSAWRMREQGAT